MKIKIILYSVVVINLLLLGVLFRNNNSKKYFEEPRVDHLRVEEVDHYNGCGILEYRPAPEEKHYMLDCSELIIRNSNNSVRQTIRNALVEIKSDNKPIEKQTE